jgi:hypothetical protein
LSEVPIAPDGTKEYDSAAVFGGFSVLPIEEIDNYVETVWINPGGSAGNADAAYGLRFRVAGCCTRFC